MSDTQQRATANLRPVDFDDPPVVETVLGVSFAPIRGWTLLHFGLLWAAKFRAHYSIADIRAPKGPIDPSDLGFSVGDDADLGTFPVRCRYMNDSRTELVHVQRNGFVRHWRATPQVPDYQHYDIFRPLFERDWRAFTEFLVEERLPSPEPWRAQVTYINHFVRGREWQSLSELPKLFPVLANSKFGEWQDLKLSSFSLGYELAGGAVRLQIEGQPGLRKSDGKEIIQLSLSATGTPSGSDPAALLEWLDIGHRAVVVNFRDFTAPKLHEIWRIK